MLENVHVDALGNLGTTVHPPDDVLALVEKFIGELYQPRTDHFNGAIFGSALDQFRAKTAMVCVCSTFAFATETTIEELKNCSKTKTLRKAVVFGSLFGRIGE